jgi:repressor of nif and glnA expression
MAFSAIMMQQLLNPPRDCKNEILTILHAQGRPMSAVELRAELGAANLENVSDTIQNHLKLKKLVEIDRKVKIKGTPNLVAYWKLTRLGEQMVKGLAEK